MQTTDVKKLCVLAMTSTIAFLLAAFVRVPIVSAGPLVLRYDPKDIIIVIAGFIYGPMAAFLVTVVVSLVQMFTVSATGFVGLFMNIVASTAFCCTAVVIYRKDRTMCGALIGLLAGAVFATAVMMAWNLILTPIFLDMPRERVMPLLLPVFLPFNLINNFLNAALTMLVYKHARRVLRTTKLISNEETGTKKAHMGFITAAFFVGITCVLWWLILRGILPF